MSTTIANIIPVVRNHLVEPTPVFWSDAELTDIAIRGIHDLWRDIADLKQEHYLTIDRTHVNFPPNSSVLTGVPADIHKIFQIEPVDMTDNGSFHGLLFLPLKYNDQTFQLARSRSPIDPTNDVVYYATHSQGAPVNAPVIVCAPQVTSNVPVSIAYVPTLGALVETDIIPIPGEADNAVIAWTVAFARAKEREDRSPDDAWLAIFATEKDHLLQSLGLRQYQEPIYVQATWQEYW